MKTVLRDIGLDLIPETTAEKETLERLFKGGANAMGTSGRLTISFADLVDKKDCDCDPAKLRAALTVV